MYLRKPPAVSIVILMIWAFAVQVHAQSYKVLHAFAAKGDASQPFTGPIIDAAGNLYGATYYGGAYGFGAVYKFDTASGKETVLHSFTNQSTDGKYPWGGLMLDKSGNLYGTTSSGGAHGWGTVFELTRTGNFKLLYSFVGYPSDGYAPQADVIQDPAGNLYGTTVSGGANDAGTVFKLSKAGKETVLYNFIGSESDGRYPTAGVITDSAGNFYGTTSEAYQGAGTVFKLDAAGALTVLYDLGSCCGLVRDTSGNLYGINGANSNGTVFEVSGTGATVLYSFTGCPTDGSIPDGTLLRDAEGNLYGSTAYGNSNSNCFVGNGVVFEIDASGRETILHNFAGYPYDGYFGAGNLVMDSAGNLYGVTGGGGPSNNGVIFEISRK